MKTRMHQARFGAVLLSVGAILLASSAIPAQALPQLPNIPGGGIALIKTPLDTPAGEDVTVNGHNQEPELSSVITTSGQIAKSYCVDNKADISDGAPYTTAKWANFRGQSNFKSSAGKVAWAASNSYPAVSLTELSSKVGRPVTAGNAIAGTQSYIWDVTGDRSQPHSAGAKAVYNYLKANATNQTEKPFGASASPLKLNATAAKNAAGKVGPYTVSGSSADLSLAGGSGTIVDTAGKTITKAAPGQQFFVQGTSGAPVLKAASKSVVAPSGVLFSSAGSQALVPAIDIIQNIIQQVQLPKPGNEVPAPTTSQVADTQAPAPQPAPAPQLPNTGASVVGLAALAGVLVAGGAGTLWYTRRRKAAAHL
ncbi:LPXTG cell wall anchor domain-containing protein [Pseudonocardiaceae bacterium YIM PH 21723]|nr:LPXTG cell wall anchor domain-containing protein [Pseudonocardiaceae bacterium YIM PH 21723]